MFEYAVKEQFFDRPAIQRAMKAMGLEKLERVAWYIRQQARRSMRQKGHARKQPKKLTGKVMERHAREAQERKPSVAPAPPHAHSGDARQSLRAITVGFDPGRGAIVVGPARLNQKQYYGGQLLAGTVPQLHEFGGTAGIREKQITVPIGRGTAGRNAKKWVPMGRRKPRQGQATRVRLARYPARPFMQPALVKAREKFKTIWYGSISAAA